MSAGSSLTPRQRALLRGAWFGPMTAEQLAVRCGVTHRLVRKFWVAEREAGRLPAAPAPRPHFAAASAPLAGDLEDDGIDYAADDAPIASPWGVAVPPGDPLLAALRAEHPHKEGLLANLPPAGWLSIEGGRNRPMDTAQLKNWLARGGQASLPMSPAQLRGLARMHDAGLASIGCIGGRPC